MVEQFKVEPVAQVDETAKEAGNAFRDEYQRPSAKEVLVAQVGDGEPAAPPPVEETEQQKQVKALTSMLSDKAVPADKKMREIEAKFKAQDTEKDMKAFEEALNTSLKGTGIQMDLRHFRGHRTNMSVLVTGVLPRPSEVFLGRPKK